MRHRRRRAKLTWLPTNGTNVEGREAADFVATPFTIALQFDPGVEQTFAIVPLNPFDVPVEADPNFNFNSQIPQATMADVIGSEYIVRRIVGNCWAAATNTSNFSASENAAVIAALGVFVARSDGENPNRPIGPDPALAAGLASFGASYNPLHSETTREPWMFRRLWMLGTRPPQVNTTTSPAASSIPLSFNQFPQTTAGYHGLRTGPFFDIKSIRRIRQDERLWMVFSAMGAPILETQALAGNYNVSATIDIRILGALRKAKNRSNF